MGLQWIRLDRRCEVLAIRTVQVRTIMINTDGHNHFIANIPTT